MSSSDTGVRRDRCGFAAVYRTRMMPATDRPETIGLLSHDAIHLTRRALRPASGHTPTQQKQAQNDENHNGAGKEKMSGPILGPHGALG